MEYISIQAVAALLAGAGSILGMVYILSRANDRAFRARVYQQRQIKYWLYRQPERTSRQRL